LSDVLKWQVKYSSNSNAIAHSSSDLSGSVLHALNMEPDYLLAALTIVLFWLQPINYYITENSYVSIFSVCFVALQCSMLATISISEISCSIKFRRPWDLSSILTLLTMQQRRALGLQITYLHGWISNLYLAYPPFISPSI